MEALQVLRDKYRKVCCSCLLWSRRNWLATNLRSSDDNEKASTSFTALTVWVDMGRWFCGLGSRAQVSSSSPQKSPTPRTPKFKKPVRPPFVVTLSSWPRITKNISLTGSPSRRIFVPSVQRAGFSRSHIASSKLSSIWSQNGTWTKKKW